MSREGSIRCFALPRSYIAVFIIGAFTGRFVDGTGTNEIALASEALSSPAQQTGTSELFKSERDQATRAARHVIHQCYSCEGHGGDGSPSTCFNGRDVCDGRRQCANGRDEQGCNSCPLCSYSRRRDTAVQGNVRHIEFFRQISKEGCARVCTDLLHDCRRFTYHSGGRVCYFYDELGRETHTPGVDLYITQVPDDDDHHDDDHHDDDHHDDDHHDDDHHDDDHHDDGPDELCGFSGRPCNNAFIPQTVPLPLRRPTPAAPSSLHCGGVHFSQFTCSADQCLSAWLVCDGRHECRVGNEENLCGTYLRAFRGRTRRPVATSRLLELGQAGSEEACAAACIWRWGSDHDDQPCTAFSYSGGSCLLGCADCAAGGTAWLDGTVLYRVVAPSEGVKALYNKLKYDAPGERAQTLHAMFRLGSLMPGHLALGDERLRLDVNGQYTDFDSRTPPLLQPTSEIDAHPPWEQPHGAPDPVTSVGYTVTTRRDVTRL